MIPSDSPTDLLEPVAGPSRVSLPVNLLTAPIEDLDVEVVRGSLANQPDVDAIHTCARLLRTRAVPIHLAEAVLEEAFHRLETPDSVSQPADDGNILSNPPSQADDDLPLSQQLRKLKDRLDTYNALRLQTAAGRRDQDRAQEGDEKMEPDDPWETDSLGGEDHVSRLAIHGDGQEDGQVLAEGLPPLLSFLSDDLTEVALPFAASGDTKSLSLLYRRHKSELAADKVLLLDALPPWVTPTSVGDLLEPDAAPVGYPRDWYVSRISYLDRLGMLDKQLSWVQQGASLGVPELDAIGEELSFLSRLIYDARLSPSEQDSWCLASWRKSEPDAIIKTYLSHSTPATIVNDIRLLILPYLYYLQSKAERAGNESANLVANYLHDLVLSLPLDRALPIFEASKATLPSSDRIIAEDQIVARLALACLYGSNTRSEWATMSAIFECLPVWDVSGEDPESDKEATSTTLDSIATFIRPTRAGTHPPTAKDLFIFFAPLPFASLSRALDILDVHLESGEILARWNTPVQLRFLLQSARNRQDQQDLAERMMRRQTLGSQTELQWLALWNDTKKLSGGADSMLRGAFGMLAPEDLMRVYLGGLLSSGSFTIAKRVIRRLGDEPGFSTGLLQSVVLQTAREFYENAETGNMNIGEMKQAYECLSVADASEVIVEEREFIEATSRLTAFSIKGRGRLSPIEIRHAKSRLDLVKKVVESSEDAYRHPDLILELTDKLGYKGDKTARAQVLAVLAVSATRHGNYEAAYEHTQALFKLSPADPERIVWRALLELGQQVEFSEIDKRMKVLGEALEICPPEEVANILSAWRKVEESQGKLSEAAKRRRIAGIRSSNRPSSTQSSSPSQPERVLGSRTAARAARLAMGFAGHQLKGITSSPLLGSSPTNQQSSPVYSESGARRSTDSDRPNFGALLDSGAVKAGTAEAERVRQQARKALVRGVGWLLGADERDLQEG